MPPSMRPIREAIGGFDPQASPGCDYRLTDDDLRRIALRGRSLLGLELGEQKRQMVYSRLSRRLRALELPSFSAYLDFLDQPAGLPETEHFANALTTNLTSFWREGHHFDHLEAFLRQSDPATLPGQRLRVWSAGCSTGEEAYTIAMVLQANAASGPDCHRRVLATDIDTNVLGTALRGIYADEKLRLLPPRFRSPSFLAPCEGGFSVAAAVRDLVVLRGLNLIGPWPFKGRFNIIFCRNVLIYFAPELRQQMIDRFVELLHPGGYLYLGHSESMLGNHPDLRAEGHTIYRRVGA